MLHVCDTCTFTRVVVSASFSSGKYFFSSGKCFCPERHNTTHNANPMKNGCDRTSSTTGTFLVSSRAHPCHRHAPRTIDSTTFSALLVGGRMVLCVSFVHMPDGPTDYRRPTPQNRTSPITGAVRPAPHPHPRCRHRPRGIGFGIGLPRIPYPHPGHRHRLGPLLTRRHRTNHLPPTLLMSGSSLIPFRLGLWTSGAEGGDCVAWHRRGHVHGSNRHMYFAVNGIYRHAHMAGILNNQPVGDKMVSGAVWYLRSLLADDRFDSIHYLICMCILDN